MEKSTNNRQKSENNKQSPAGANPKTSTSNSRPHTTDAFNYADILKKSGLTGKEARVFNFLIEKGESGAKQIISGVNLKRGDTYNQLYSLKNKGLVSERSVSGRMKFSAQHPSEIEEYLERRSKRLEEAQKELKAILPSIVSTYNLSYHKPGVKVFEGDEGSVRMMWDTLTSKTEILQIIDPSSLERHLKEENSRYVKERVRRGISKRVILPDTSYARRYIEQYSGELKNLTQFALAKIGKKSFHTSIQIYDNKYALHTLKPKISVGIIIEDPTICELQRGLFEFMWNASKKLQ